MVLLCELHGKGAFVWCGGVGKGAENENGKRG